MSQSSKLYYGSEESFHYRLESQAAKGENERRIERLKEIRKLHPVVTKMPKAPAPTLPMVFPASKPKSKLGSNAYYRQEERRNGVIKRNEKYEVESRGLHRHDL